jgi:hypothetical protein
VKAFAALACGGFVAAFTSGLRAEEVDANGAKHERMRWTSALELTAFGGYALHVGPHDVRGRIVSSWNGGGALAGGIVYRSPHFLRVLSPFVDVGYYPLRRASVVPDGEGAPGESSETLHASLRALGIAAGLAADVWRVRVCAGVALYDVTIDAATFGRGFQSRELDGGYLLSLGGTVVQRERLQVGAEVRVGVIVEADMPFVAVGSTIRGQALTW